jgi:acyl carrier protein/malonyl CoA-acyl carrier protein transacylase
VPVYANATSQPYKTTAKELAAALASQIASPVLFREQIEAMYGAGARIFVEVGPGNVVAGLVSDTLGTRPYTVLSLDNKRNNGVAQFLGAIGALAVAGLTLDFAALYAEAPAPAPKMAPSKHAVFLTGANYDRPYPPKNGAAGRAPPNATARPIVEPVSLSTPSTPPPQRTEPLMPDQNGRQPVPSSPAPAAQAGARVELSSPVERIWEQVSARHQDYLHAMADSHRAYLNAAASLLGQAGALPAEPQMLAAPTAAPARAPAPPVSKPEPVVYAEPVPAPKPKTNGSGGSHAFTPPAAPAPAVRTVSVAAKPVAPAPVAPAAASIDAAGIVRAIVSEKTGYPPDMLDVDMDLEGELGVDSIKQVEILSALRDRLPHLPEIEPERLVELRTIAAIAAMISAATPSASAAPAPAAAPTFVSKPAAVAASSSVLVSADVVRALIAEKTGYPSDMLEDDMDLEGELGVDSIKQVEILSALRDQYPSLPEVDPEHLAELRTIRKIADFFG